MKLTVDLTGVPDVVRRALHENASQDNAREIVKALDRQTQIARVYHGNRPRSRDGIGPMEMCIDPYFRGYFEMQYGSCVLHDADLRKFVLRRNPELRVESTGTRTQIGPGDCSRPAGRAVGFRKVYGSNQSGKSNR